MHRSVAVILIAATAGVGAFLAAGYGHDGRGMSWLDEHLAFIRKQLEGLKDSLRLYKEAHGRYPTNDEGLAVLDTFESRFKTRFALPKQEMRGAYGGLLGGSGFWPRELEICLEVFRIRNERSPETADEFFSTCRIQPSQALSLKGLDLSRLGDEWSVYDLEMAIDRNNNLYVLTPGGVVSPWHIPYVYENRNGLDAALFADSPANDDGRRRYSVEVDDGIYVYSVGGQSYAEEYDAAWRRRNVPRFAGARCSESPSSSRSHFSYQEEAC